MHQELQMFNITNTKYRDKLDICWRTIYFKPIYSRGEGGQTVATCHV